MPYSQAAAVAPANVASAGPAASKLAARPLGSLGWPAARDEVVYFHLSDKMPDFALQSHFEKYGPVIDVCLHAKDPTCASMPCSVCAQLTGRAYAHKLCAGHGRAVAPLHAPATVLSISYLIRGCNARQESHDIAAEMIV